MTARRLIVAIDGRSGAGKGTVAREVARRLNYKHLDTGAMYRAVAWKALHDAVPLESEDAVAEIAQRASLDVGPASVVIDGHDVTAAIRTPEIDRAAALRPAPQSACRARRAPTPGRSERGHRHGGARHRNLWCFRTPT